MKKLAAAYSLIAVTLLTVLLLLLSLNGLAALALMLRPLIDRHVVETSSFLARYGEQVYDLYPDMTREQVHALLGETWSRPLVYEDITQFRERPFTGDFVNVTKAGYRQVDEAAPWPIDPAAFNVFVYGGSTTFGYGVADAETVPAALQRLLHGAGQRAVTVYNFGRGFYDSSHEMLLFLRHLYQGVVPDTAIFIDGTNEFRMAGRRTLVRSEEMAPGDEPDADDDQTPGFAAALRQTALARSVDWAFRRFGGDLEGAGGGRHVPMPQADGGEADARAAIKRYRNNSRVIRGLADAYGVRRLFVWQPVPSYGYDLSYHPFGLSADQVDPAQVAGYAMMDELRDAGALGTDFLWCGDVQADVTKTLYIDAVHYAPPMAELIADCIAEGALSVVTP